MFCPALSCIALRYPVLCCIILHCPAVSCSLLLCIVLHNLYTVLSNYLWRPFKISNIACDISYELLCRLANLYRFPLERQSCTTLLSEILKKKKFYAARYFRTLLSHLFADLFGFSLLTLCCKEEECAQTMEKRCKTEQVKESTPDFKFSVFTQISGIVLLRYHILTQKRPVTDK
jgi:hypothetical protein